jgi:hypothetical protein
MPWPTLSWVNWANVRRALDQALAGEGSFTGEQGEHWTIIREPDRIVSYFELEHEAHESPPTPHLGFET